ncbi:RNA polymerase sigma-70 factor [Chitinophaga oryzae]|uniref:RNA polymerase sigma-70 factor n=1 Tax=Chitinophaga oryzae TaxID=2725414 RepID=A0AAE6ZGR7_9BACT|nr:RNA polymerase sigma-70 factor [Chitinophaga oryzae]QJB32473.1 RNA polymerase sigma-70 factor [Chitinophaga oryzae]
MSMQSDILEPASLFKAYYPRLCYFAFQFTGDKDQARDIAQEAFVSYLGQRAQVAPHPVAVKNFLYTSVRNACLNLLRHEKVVEKFAASQAAPPPDDTTVILTMIRSEVLGEINRVLQTLPEACQEVIRLGYIEGLKNQEIAHQLNISVNTVKTQKKRGLHMLRQRLDPEMYTLFFL